MRQVEELHTHTQLWYGHAIKICTPGLLARLQKVTSTTTTSSTALQVKKCVSFQLNCGVLHPEELSDLVLTCTFPINYPEEEVCSVAALLTNNATGTTTQSTSVADAINTYLAPMLGCDCIEMIVEWLANHKQTCLIETGATTEDPDHHGKAECYVLRYNHLLNGPEHKKEKQMVASAKSSKLQGGLLWGTPGIVVVVPPCTEEDATEYARECRTIGKKCAMEVVWLPQQGLEKGGLGGLPQAKRGGKLQSMSTTLLRTVCGEDEDLLRTVLGIG